MRLKRLVDEYIKLMGDGEHQQAQAVLGELERHIEFLETALSFKTGTIRDVRVGPPGAVFAMEGIKNAEKNAKDPNYVPSWNPGKINAAGASDEDLTEVLKNPLLSDEVREWLKSKG